MLFDDESIVDYSLGDVNLYVNTLNRLVSVNPFTGEVNGTIGTFPSEDDIEEVAYRANGELFAYSDSLDSGFGFNDANYYRVNSSDAGLNGPLSRNAGFSVFGGTVIFDQNGVPTFVLGSAVGFNIEAMAIGAFQDRGDLEETGFFVASRGITQEFIDAGLEFNNNALFEFDPANGRVVGRARTFVSGLFGFGSSLAEIGRIDTTAVPGRAAFQLGITNASEIGPNGILVPSLLDGDTFTLDDGDPTTDPVTFELNTGITLTADGQSPVRDGDTVTIDGVTFEFDAGQRLQLDNAEPTGSLADGTRVTVTLTDGTSQVFEFDRDGNFAAESVPISLVNNVLQPLSANQLANSLANAINNALPGVNAGSLGDEIFFSGVSPQSLAVTGTGISVSGQPNVTDPNNIAVSISDPLDQAGIIKSLAAAIRAQGIAVSDVGTRLTLPGSGVIDVTPETGGALSISGDPDVVSGNIEIFMLPSDPQQVIASRISTAIENVADAGNLINVAATPVASGRSIAITGEILATTGNLVRGGLRTNGNITGLASLGDTLFAVDDNGGLYSISSQEVEAGRGLITRFDIGDYIESATDLRGINFSGLREGPLSYNNGELRRTLFGLTSNGDIYAFNTAGELQPIFAGGRSMISTGIGGARGLDFSTLGYNLWHTTNQRSGDAGHGINALPNGARDATAGGTSLAFSFEGSAFNGNYPTLEERPAFTARQDGTLVEDSYNLPGGAKGVVESNAFSLEGVSAADQPTLYYNYFSETDDGADRLRVYVIDEDGVEHLLASNTDSRGNGTSDDEFDDPTTGVYDDDIDVEVQQIFDNTDSWRQARVPLGEFAGQADLRLRIEFSTNGLTETTSASIRTISGERLSEGQQLTIGGELFTIDFAPTVHAPAGIDLANNPVGPNTFAIVTIDGQDFVLTDDVTTVAAGQTPVDLLAGFPVGTTVADLTASQIAEILAEAVRLNPPPNPVVAGLDFSDETDDPANPTGNRNDLLFQATPLPYESGNLRLSGNGRFGTLVPDNPPINRDDVDLLRLEVIAGTQIAVDVELDFNAGFESVVRFFDVDGNDLSANVTTNDGIVTLTAPTTGLVYIGLSGLGNDAYDPRIAGTTAEGLTDAYSANIDINVPLLVQTDGNVIEFGGTTQISANPVGLFNIEGQSTLTGTPISVSRFETAEQVADRVQRVLADRFSGGDISLMPSNGANVRLPALNIGDAGPFADTAGRYGDQFGVSGANRATVAASDNAFEGVYLDDFIIGFAERGELATQSNAVTQAFVPDDTRLFPQPDDPVSDLVTGAYQVEIRDASEYVASGRESQFRTFDTNDRFTDSRSITARPADEIRDGLTFSLFDGRSEVVFEFDLIESNTDVVPGNVRIPFTLEFTDPDTGQIRPQNATEVAASIIDAINRTDVQSIIDSPALPSSGVDTVFDPTINLFGEVIVTDQDGSLASINRGLLRGDDNRDRDGQGVILVENSRFLFNDQYGLNISHGLTANVDGTDTQSILRYPRNLVELNTESLVPGVVVQSNVIAFNGLGGLQIEGIDSTVTETISDPLPFERIVNNTIIGGVVSAGAESPSATFQGVLFPQGLISFADAVVSFDPNAGGNPSSAIHQNADTALGAPDCFGRGPEPADGQFSVSIGLAGTLTLQFTDNLLTGSGDAAPDLIVFETGAVESVRVEISRDGVTFIDVGDVGGISNTIDIDAFGFGTESRFAFVRLTDLRQGDTTGAPLGADIDAVGALSTVSVESFTAGGNGINIVGNAAPALLNNVIANSEQGIAIDPANTSLLIGGNAYYRNTANVPDGFTLGEFPQVLTESEAVFVAASNLVFAPAAGASIIDSSIDSVEDRPSLTTVKNPLGLPPSPILAPRLDVNGQLRVDDPNVETPSGLGERVFKDRGASDRGDQTGPRVVLVSPQAPNLGLDSGMVTVLGSAPDAFEIQLLDGLSPADITPGTGIDDRSVSNQSVLLLKNNEPQIEGIDYRFGYNPSTNIIRITPIAGVFEENATYVVRMVDATDAIISASSGVSYVDGTRFNLVDLNNQTTTFEYETGVVMTIAAATTGETADGITFDVFDGTNTLLFELDNNSNVDPSRNPIPIPQVGTADQIAAAIGTTLANATGLNLTVNVADNRVQFLGSSAVTSVTSNSAALTVAGQVGTSIGFGLQIPFEGGRPADSINDGQTFTVSRGAARSVTFELDTDNQLDDTDNTPVRFNENATLDQIADAIVAAIGGAQLGLDPSNAGFGRVLIGGDANYSVDLTNSVLQQLEVPGAVATVPIVIPINQSGSEVAQTIAATILSTGLPGVATSVVDTRVFVEGTGGISGTGAVELITIRDEVGNELQSNQTGGRTELTIFVGSGFDYGDAPAPYASEQSQGGPRHAVDPSFTLGATINADSDALLDDADNDDGITVAGLLQTGFATNVSINVNADAGRTFYVDAWFDWDADGQFESGEQLRFGSADTGRSVLGIGTNVVSVNVPASAASGETYARFRLSESPNLGPVGDATSGEVEDVRLLVGSNPFQNPSNRLDVNGSGTVTPIDAIQIINALNRAGSTIDLSAIPLPSGLPRFPDVNADGRITSSDAFTVINALSRGETGNGEGEQATQSFVQTGSGVLASSATVLGDALILGDAQISESATPQTVLQPETTITSDDDESTSVFDHPSVVGLDSLVDDLAADTAHNHHQDSPDDGTNALDQLFAQL